MSDSATLCGDAGSCCGTRRSCPESCSQRWLVGGNARQRRTTRCGPRAPVWSRLKRLYLYTMCKPIKKQLPVRLGALSGPLGAVPFQLAGVATAPAGGLPGKRSTPRCSRLRFVGACWRSSQRELEERVPSTCPWLRPGERRSVSSMAMLTSRVISAGAARSPRSDSHGWRPVVSATPQGVV